MAGPGESGRLQPLQRGTGVRAAAENRAIHDDGRDGPNAEGVGPLRHLSVGHVLNDDLVARVDLLSKLLDGSLAGRAPGAKNFDPPPLDSGCCVVHWFGSSMPSPERTVHLPPDWKVKGPSVKTGDVLIGQLAERVGVTTKSIRFYESISLLPVPSRSSSGYRVYTDVDVQRLAFIKTAQRLGLSLDEIREIIALRDRGEPPCAYVADVLQSQVDVLDHRIHEMGQLRHELQELQAAAAAGDRGGRFCGVIEHAPNDHQRD